MNRHANFLLVILLPALLAATAPAHALPPAKIPFEQNISNPSSIRFAVIGDYGLSGQAELDVANQVKSWNPDFIVTLGDNNYNAGGAGTIDANIGQYYHDYIFPYTGSYGAGAATNKFFPILGNHDWIAANAQPYLNYFSLPGNERYYDFVQGPVHFFMLDSDPHEPDGNAVVDAQAAWLENALAASSSSWNIVLLHHAPFSSALHGSNATLQWPYEAWGADAVLAGHDHTYERIINGTIPFFVNGLGGASIYNFGAPIAGSQLRFNADYGAMLVDADAAYVNFKFITRSGALIDSYALGTLPIPSVNSITRTDVNPSSAANIDFTVTFSENVTGVDSSDFSLTTSGVLGAAMSGLSGSGSIYTVTVNTGSGSGTIKLNVTDNDSIVNTFTNPLGGSGAGNGNFTSGETYTVTKTWIFGDVPNTYWSWSFIERLYNAGITGGCSAIPLNYCPTNQVTRAQMAIFLVRAMHGVAFVPPAATGVFSDVPVGSFGANFIEQLAADSITSGCGGGNFCPNSAATRAQMAVFLVRAKHGIAFVPPTATGIFSDVPVGSFGADFIEQLAADSITSGCGAGIYCPSTTVKRDSMAVFLVRTFNLP
ncbi:MAG: metallophosphoesterase [Chloroflexi bacterium]|nr:metallophosphoesterase [Chloroflexota bacterium]